MEDLLNYFKSRTHLFFSAEQVQLGLCFLTVYYDLLCSWEGEVMHSHATMPTTGALGQQSGMANNLL